MTPAQAANWLQQRLEANGVRVLRQEQEGPYLRDTIIFEGHTLAGTRTTVQQRHFIEHRVQCGLRVPDKPGSEVLAAVDHLLSLRPVAPIELLVVEAFQSDGPYAGAATVRLQYLEP